MLSFKHQVYSLVLVKGDEREATEPLSPLVLHEPGLHNFAILGEVLLQLLILYFWVAATDEKLLSFLTLAL